MSEMLDRLEAVIREAFKDEEAFVSQMDVIWVRDKLIGLRPRVLAKLMLKAMREPTDAMWRAANPRGQVLSDQKKWEAMIDEALR